MSEEKSTIYISKRCQYCRQLLGILKSRPDVRGTIKIVVIDEEPFPNIVKNVPAMIDTKGELWSAQEIFSALTESETQGKQQQQQIQQQQRQGQNLHLIHNKDNNLIHLNNNLIHLNNKDNLNSKGRKHLQKECLMDIARVDHVWHFHL